MTFGDPFLDSGVVRRYFLISGPTRTYFFREAAEAYRMVIAVAGSRCCIRICSAIYDAVYVYAVYVYVVRMMYTYM